MNILELIRERYWNMVVNNSIHLENKFLKFKEYINSQGIDSKIESFTENDSIP